MPDVNMHVNIVFEMVREIHFFATEQGRKPVEDFLDSLSSKQAQKATWVMSLIEDLPVVPKRFFKKMIGTEDIWEIRIEYDLNIFRILGFFDGAIFFVAAHAFQKKSQKVPMQEIRIAEERKREYFRRKRHERP
ncbi:MAG: type II toxin-antitoxin system RelE/ParE family toxin [Methanothrix sp.]|nr:type II toxin-antitoxin system RelE/ParE family toxin [Methanothrix sp.]